MTCQEEACEHQITNCTKVVLYHEAGNSNDSHKEIHKHSGECEPIEE